MSNASNVYVTSDGRTLEIPAGIFAQTKFTKTGAPDKRADNTAFDAWLASQQGPALNGDAEYYPEPAASVEDERLQASNALPQWVKDGGLDVARAQAYAMRVWAGQNADLYRNERIARCTAALIGQGLPTEGVKYPGESMDDSEWTEEDERPVTWRKAGA
jgi:hypothetical protein